MSWTALAGGVPPPVFPTFATSPYRLTAIALAVLFAARWRLRGSPVGGFELPPWLIGRAVAVARRVARACPSPASRARAAAAAAVTAAGIALVVLASHLQTGLTGRYYDEPDWSGAILIEGRDRDLTLRRAIYDLVNPDYRYSIEWSGVIYIPARGRYQFALSSDGSSELRIAGTPIAIQGGVDGPGRAEGTAGLLRGFHGIRVRYAHAHDAYQRVAIEWRPASDRDAGSAYRPLSTAWLFPEEPARVWFWLCRLAVGLEALVGLALLAVLSAACVAGCHWLLAARAPGAWDIGLDGALLAAAVVLYLAAGFVLDERFWGFGYLSVLGVDRALAWLFLAGVAILAYRRHGDGIAPAFLAAERHLRAHRAAIVAAAVLGVLLFVALRSEFVTSDGVMFRWQVPMAARGEDAINFDEMWEAYLHSRFWLLTNQAFGWSVRLSYQVASALAGGAFLVLLWAYARRLVPGAPLAFSLLMVSGGYMQLFVGEVENYSLAAVAIFAYLVASTGYLQGRWPLVVPSAALALAMTCHMLSGFLLPSLGLLFVLELRRRAFFQIGLSLLVWLSIVLGTMWLLGVSVNADSWGTRALRALVSAGAGDAAAESGHASRWAPIAFDAYHWDQYNHLALMLPAHLMLIALLAARRIRMDRVNVFLILASLCMAGFQFNYRALLSVRQDWNLFASAAIPLAVLVWRNALEADGVRHKAETLIGWAALSFLHSSAWIVSNHRFAP